MAAANYTVTEAAKVLGAQPGTMYSWIKAGNIKTVKKDGKIMLNKRLINKMKKDGTGPKNLGPRKKSRIKAPELERTVNTRQENPDPEPTVSAPVRNGAGFDRKGLQMFPLPTNGSAELVSDLSKLCMRHGLTSVRDGIDYIDHALST